MRICIHYWVYGETDPTPAQHVLETVIPFASTLLIAQFVSDVGTVFSLVGSVETCCTFFLFPAAIALFSPMLKAKGFGGMWLRPLCVLLLILGTLFLVLGVASTLSEASGASVG